jgi:hypothetical protein
LRIFISYSSKHREICERLQLALEADGRHEVFVDRAELQPGQPFDEKIRQGLMQCDLLLFLISPESVAPGSYALAELDVAKRRWRHPGGRVLPVKVAPTNMATIPPYLRAVTILEPQGDLVAHTVAAVEEMRPPPTTWRKWALLATLVLSGVLASAAYVQWQKQRAEQARAVTLTSVAQQLCASGDHALAWLRFDEALAQFAQHQALRRAREDCGMRWLQGIRVEVGKEKMTDIVNKVLPVLAEGAAAEAGQRGADLRAHMGWADFLRLREGASGMNPPAHYERALALEPGNVYAHAMWGHHIMVQSQPIADAKRHFEAALASGRERTFVRNFQFAALLYYRGRQGQLEALRVADEMRKGGETVDARWRERLWTYVYNSELMPRGSQRDAFMAALPQSGNPATFAWLYPQDQTRDDRKHQWSFFMASLEDAAGNRSAAGARYAALRDELVRQRFAGSMLDETNAALDRLRRSAGTSPTAPPR